MELEDIFEKRYLTFLEWAIGVKYIPFSWIDFVIKWNERHRDKYQLDYSDDPEQVTHKLVHIYKAEKKRPLLKVI